MCVHAMRRRLAALGLGEDKSQEAGDDKTSRPRARFFYREAIRPGQLLCISSFVERLPKELKGTIPNLNSRPWKDSPGKMTLVMIVRVKKDWSW